MSRPDQIQHPYLQPIVNWARSEDAIRAVVITGSLARFDGSTDEYSDLDAQIITADIGRYTADDSWLDDLGEVWIRFPLYEDLPYRLVWFAGGVKVDFQFITVESIRAMLQAGNLSDEYLRGYWVALDKDGFYSELPPSPRVFPQPPAPSCEQLHALINEFWFEAIHVAQFIRRREFWVVKFRDWTMKSNLLQLLEWRGRAAGGGDANTWLLGKRMSDWTDDATLVAVSEIWSPWDAGKLWTSLLTQMTLFRRLSRELADALGYRIAIDAACDDIERYIRHLRDEDKFD